MEKNLQENQSMRDGAWRGPHCNPVYMGQKELGAGSRYTRQIAGDPVPGRSAASFIGTLLACCELFEAR